MGTTKKIAAFSGVNWDSTESHVLLNPRWPAVDREALNALALENSLPAHVWIPSSGSSTDQFQSVKLIALSKAALLASAEAVNHHVEATKKDIWALALPYFHVGGLGLEARAALSGNDVIDCLDDGRWSADFFYEAVKEKKLTLSALVPTQVYDLVQLGKKAPASLRAIIVGGGALSENLYESAVKLGWNLLPSYGMTECCSQVATARLSSIGKQEHPLVCLPHLQVKVDGDAFLMIKGSSLLTGYAQWADGKAIWTDPKKDGWFRTADRAEIHDNCVTPLGRSSDYVKISGEGVNLLHLQQLLESVAQKLAPEMWEDFALIALEDERTQNQLVLLTTGRVEARLIQTVIHDFNQKVAPYEKLKRQHFVDEISRSPLGKLLREKLKKKISAA
ncbi:MAG: o-succinylbenzoate--CoA ligase [Bdellovibrio sp. CG10_big_fil_rev_8_21_14_0_10_47_8]|nr:MAG: o-succinylbenzoate--CoA ligase [Bdellovibrio sp. CG10_big_fil_rev_8_21_14_0_10_47_8]